jgi:hypothetical protein
MVKRLILPLLALTIAACEADHAKVRSLLEAEGCKDTQVGGWVMTGCGKDDSQSNEFSCTKNGVKVRGVVCSSWGPFSKGMTVRYF